MIFLQDDELFKGEPTDILGNFSKLFKDKPTDIFPKQKPFVETPQQNKPIEVKDVIQQDVVSLMDQGYSRKDAEDLLF